MKCLLLVAALVAAARAQIPSLGFCPEYLPMTDFDMDRFTGIWHEAERYFQLTEVASRCVTSNYTKTSSGKYYVINEVMSRFTGVKRVLEGEIRRSPLKGEEGKLVVKYTTVPVVPYESSYNVLETDYDTYAVLWSCTGIGPVHTQNAWIMTRQRLAPGDVLQKAYGVLDRYKISKVFFVKTNQDDCAYLEDNQPIKPTEPPKKASTEAAQVAETEESEGESEEAPAPLAGKSAGGVRGHIVPDAPEVIIQTRKAEIEAKEKAAEAVKAAAIQQPAIEALQADEAVRSVPEVIMKIADQAKQEVQAPAVEAAVAEEAINEEISETPILDAIKEIKKGPIQEAIEQINKKGPIQEAIEQFNKTGPIQEAIEQFNKTGPIQEAINEINKEASTKQPIDEPAKPAESPAEEPVLAATEAPKEAAAPLEPVAAAAPVVAEVKEPDVQPLKTPEPIVEEKIEIAQP